MTARPRVLLITRNLPPLRGGMERLNLHIAIELSARYDLIVVGPEGCGAHLPATAKVREIPVRPLWRFLVGSLVASWKEARNSPCLVIAGSGLMAPATWVAASRSRARSAVYVHGLDLVTPHLLYRLCWLPAMRRLDLALANSANTADLARRAAVAKGRVTLVHPGTDWPAAMPPRDNPFRARFGLGEGPILLSVGRLTERKGLAEFIDRSFLSIVREHPSARLVIIGDEAPDALNRGQADQSARLQTAIEASGMRDSVVRAGACDDATLAHAYASADVHVFPVRQVAGDVEGFGMVAIEAAAHGLPTVAFAVGGVPDAVRDGESGYVVRPGDYDRFARRVCQILSLSSEDAVAWVESSREFARGFDWKLFGERLHKALDSDESVGSGAARAGHAVLDLTSRAAKARKIELLLGLSAKDRPLRLLEVGTGSGGIAHYFGNHPSIDCEVEAVDLEDSRQIFDGYRFTKVQGTELPFDDSSFDVVISNHVIEHVGDEASQLAHLTQLRRVLRQEGIGYLAMPNRWMLVEPHYQLAFLSWWPERWRTRWLRFWRRGEEYDCRPLSRGALQRLLASAGFRFEQLHASALRTHFEIERPDAAIWRHLLRRLPDWMYGAAAAIFPTLIYRLERTDAVGGRVLASVNRARPQSEHGVSA